MNLPNDTEEWVAWSAHLPKPTLRPEARQRSLAAAIEHCQIPANTGKSRTLAARLPRHTSFTLRRSSPSGRSHKLLNIHTLSWAACWIVSLSLWLQSPQRPAEGDSSGVLAESLTHYQLPSQDPETQKLLASIYPTHRWSRIIGLRRSAP